MIYFFLRALLSDGKHNTVSIAYASQDALLYEALTEHISITLVLDIEFVKEGLVVNQRETPCLQQFVTQLVGTGIRACTRLLESLFAHQRQVDSDP